MWQQADNPYLLAIDLHCAVNTHLARLSHAAGKQCPVHCGVEAPLQGGIGHLHVRCRYIILGPDRCTRSPARRKATAVVLGQVSRANADDSWEATTEHALPLVLLDMLAMVGARDFLSEPFLLEEGYPPAGEAEIRKIV